MKRKMNSIEALDEIISYYDELETVFKENIKIIRHDLDRLIKLEKALKVFRDNVFTYNTHGGYLAVEVTGSLTKNDWEKVKILFEDKKEEEEKEDEEI